MLSSSLCYTEWPPSPALAKYVDCYRVLQSHGTALPAIPARVLPTGQLDVLFSFGTTLNLPGITAQDTKIPVQTYLAGPMDAAFDTTLVGCLDILWVRFKLGCGALFTQSALHEVVGHNVVLDMLRRPEQTAMLERMAATPDMRQRIALFEQWFIQAVQQRTALDADVIQAVALIERSQGNLPIEHLAQTLNLSGDT